MPYNKLPDDRHKTSFADIFVAGEKGNVLTLVN